MNILSLTICAPITPNIYFFVLGALFGFIACIFWERFGIPDFIKKYISVIISSIIALYPEMSTILEKLPIIISAWEHYHIGLVLLLLAKHCPPPLNNFMHGISMALIIDERFQDHPFGMGKETEDYSIIIGIVLLLILCFI